MACSRINGWLKKTCFFFFIFSFMLCMSKLNFAGTHTINFDEQRYRDIANQKFYRGGPNTMVDQVANFDIYIANGEMFIDPYITQHFPTLYDYKLWYSYKITATSPDHTDPAARLVITFDNLQQYVKVTGENDLFPYLPNPYARVSFYKDTSPTNPLYSENSAGCYAAEYTNTTDGIKMIIVDSKYEVNYLEELKFTDLGDPVSSEPDLIVSNVTVMDGDGPDITYKVTVKNEGAAPTGGKIKTRFFLSLDNTITTADYLINDWNFTDALAPGDTKTSWDLATTVSNVPDGTYYLGAITDANNVCAESDETNNTGYANSPMVTISGSGIDPGDPSGNMLANGDFSNGMDPWHLYVINTGDAATDVEDGALHVSITNGGANVWDVSLQQLNLNIINGSTYTVTFDARAASERDVSAWVAMLNAPYSMYNSDNEFSLTTNWQTFSYTFTMNYDTDPAARIGFDFGTSNVDAYLDNVSLVEHGSGSSDEPEEPDGNHVSNWSFNNDMNDWTFYAGSYGAEGSASVENGVFHAQITNGGTETWCTHLKQNITIENGKTYDVSFEAYGDDSRNIWPIIGLDTDPWTSYNGFVEFNISTTKQTYSFGFTMTEPTDNNARLQFDMGISNIDVYLDNISVVETGSSNDIQAPEISQTARVFDLAQNYPNPFNPKTFIRYQIPENGLVKLKIYDLAGREITTLVNENQTAGMYTSEWNAEGLPSGMYLYQLKANEFLETKKLILQK